MRKYKLFSIFLLSLILNINVSAVIGPIPIYLNPEIIDSSFHNDYGIKSTFSHEVYSKDQIISSSASNLYDFLTQYSSLSFTPSSGNKYSQEVELRGYGLTNGALNIGFFINGMKLNNIDISLPNLSLIDINNIKKIEIIKGSGSVEYGDHATSGVVNIITDIDIKNRAQVSLSDNNEKISFSLNENIKKNKLNLSGEISKDHGEVEPDSNGNSNSSNQTKYSLSYSTKDKTNYGYNLNFTKSHLKNYYPHAITLAEFNSNASRLYSSDLYTKSEVSSESIQFDNTKKINQNIKLNTSASIENLENIKYWASSSYGSPSINKYQLYEGNLSSIYDKKNLKISSGLNYLHGDRDGNSGYLVKNNIGVFADLNYSINDSTILSLGTRFEDVAYSFSKNTENTKERFKLNAFEFGINKELSSSLSSFVNINKAFSSPFVDQLFTYDFALSKYRFTGFTLPTKTITLNSGFNYVTKDSNSKIALFFSDIENEMYLNPVTYQNENLDETHKYGLEVNSKYKINDFTNINFSYSFTDSRIDKEASNSSYVGKSIPMSSKHKVSLGINHQINDKNSLIFTHKYRSSSFASNDFSNSLPYKQKQFSSSDLIYNYDLSNDSVFSLDIENLFNQTYGTFTEYSTVYPSQFSRNISASFKYSF